ncbi:MAG: alpha/beta hydrolase [Spirochaetaceae bacterium]|nr:MAG: alpha/beta hydrolase [Spirochaetaceae bacterium]
MFSSLLRGAIIAVTIVLFFLFLIPLLERRMVFHPVRHPHGNWAPEQFDLPVEDHWFETEDGVTLHGWYARAEQPVGTTLLWSQGNAGNLTYRMQNMRLLLDYGIDVFIYDYRGYGRSQGNPTEVGIYADARAAYDYLARELQIAPREIVLFGRSLGSAVAVDLALQRDVAGVILEAPLTNARDMSRRLVPLLPVHRVISTQLDSLAKIPNINVPVLIIHGDRDNVVPIEQGKRLYAAAGQPRQFYTVEGAGHNDTFVVGGNAYFELLRDFVSGL